MAGLGGDRQQGFDGFDIGGHQAAGIMALAGHNHCRSVQAGDPVQGFGLNSRAASQDHLPGPAAHARLVDQLVQLFATGFFRQYNQPQFLGIVLFQKALHPAG